MAKVKQIGVRGLRSFGYEKQLVPFSRINIYVGKNSCGKSSYLRTYPLLRQSTESDKTSPILWYAGHQGYVDFGDFATTLHDGGDKIHFDFQLAISTEDELKKSRKIYGGGPNFISRWIEPGLEFDIDFTLSLEKLKTGIQSTVRLTEGENTATLVFSGDEFKEINLHNSKWDHTISISVPKKIEKGCLIPKDGYTVKEVTYKGLGKVYVQADLTAEPIEKLTQFLKAFHHKSKKAENILESIENIPLCSRENLYRYLVSAFKSDKFFFRRLEENKQQIVDIVYSHLFLKSIRYFLVAADTLFEDFYGGVRYLGPLRASAERFYRFQEVQVQEIDHTGSNLPMVINSLSKTLKNRLSEWIKESFDFELELQSTGLHYALRIKENGDTEFHNVSDMGFGYSQILPVIVSLWLELSANEEAGLGMRRARRKSRTLVIEQPELHLHPALQYKFGIAIAKVIKLAKTMNIDYNFVIETHSKQLIDAIGDSVSDDVVSKDDVNIALFEKSSTGTTKLRLAGFDSEGYLENWPAGFLSA